MRPGPLALPSGHCMLGIRGESARAAARQSRCENAGSGAHMLGPNSDSRGPTVVEGVGTDIRDATSTESIEV